MPLLAALFLAVLCIATPNKTNASEGDASGLEREGKSVVIDEMAAARDNKARLYRGSTTKKLTNVRRSSVLSGTGFFINKHGFMLTAAHVVKACSTINVKGAVAETKAQLVAMDSDSDLALLKVDTKPKYSAAIVSRADFIPGEELVIAGYPGRHGLTRTHATRRTAFIDDMGPTGEQEWIQFADSIAKGNSGGPLLDNHGNVVGLISAKLTKTYPYSGRSEVRDIAVNANTIYGFLDHYGIQYQTSSRGIEEARKKASRIVANVHCHN